MVREKDGSAVSEKVGDIECNFVGDFVGKADGIFVGVHVVGERVEGGDVGIVGEIVGNFVEVNGIIVGENEGIRVVVGTEETVGKFEGRRVEGENGALLGEEVVGNREGTEVALLGSIVGTIDGKSVEGIAVVGNFDGENDGKYDVGDCVVEGESV